MKTITSIGLLFCLLFALSGCGGGDTPKTGSPNGNTNTGGTTLPTNKAKYKLAVSIYVGWMPWYYAQDEGIIKKWADKYGIEVEVVRMDYIPSVEAYVAKQVDACVMTNMEGLNMPAASGIDTTVVVTGDYSNGNDGILVRDGLTVKDLAGKEVALVELSVSHYLLARALEMNGVTESSVKVINTSDSDIATAFTTNSSLKAIVTWNPMLMNAAQTKGVTKPFDSSKIPGEILDLLVVRTDVVNKDPRLAMALTGAWYEVMGVMSEPGPLAREAKAKMAALSNCSLSEFEAQLATTAMYWTAEEAAKYTSGPAITKSMDYVRQFSFKHKLLGENAKSADDVGIEFPDGTVLGDKAKVKLRFSDRFMKEAAAGKITLK